MIQVDIDQASDAVAAFARKAAKRPVVVTSRGEPVVIMLPAGQAAGNETAPKKRASLSSILRRSRARAKREGTISQAEIHALSAKLGSAPDALARDFGAAFRQAAHEITPVVYRLLDAHAKAAGGKMTTARLKEAAGPFEDSPLAAYRRFAKTIVRAVGPEHPLVSESEEQGTKSYYLHPAAAKGWKKVRREIERVMLGR